MRSCMLYVMCLLLQLPAATHIDGMCHDAERQREIPWRAHLPEPLEEPCPVIIFSHGLGGSKNNYMYIGQHLADSGYICFHIQHPGSDVGVWKGARSRAQIMQKLQASIRDPNNAINRYRDHGTFLDYLETLNQEHARLQGLLDLQRIGMAGHSYGSRSTLAAAGERISPLKISYRDQRIKAGVLMSPNQSEWIKGNAREWYTDITIPLFHMTGTEDGGVLAHQQGMTWEDRIKPWQAITAEAQYLLVLDEADHRTFSGLRSQIGREKPRDQEHLQLIKTGVQYFFDAYVRDQAAAQTYLHETYKEQCSKHRFEWK